ncbi:hypothetical protein FGG08_006328 [Glutinoglossum americanum]|uniref:AAA+ ATPase domain-containing protein n=1 Tax=Glutinoglossum americanum TaxID=1670608 RepID=A0A9P8I145_9PEZI|nr:hypothetical protein FGG08_006328 [Glutinoglossum americanum]
MSPSATHDEGFDARVLSLSPNAMKDEAFNAKVTGLHPDTLSDDELDSKVVVVPRIGLDNSKFDEQLAELLKGHGFDIKFAREGGSTAQSECDLDSESESDDSSSASERLDLKIDEIKKDCNEFEKTLLDAVIKPDDIHTTFSDIRVNPSVIRTLRTLTTLALAQPEAFTYGILSKEKILGVLLHGPPGTGKTLLAKAVAKEAHATVLEVSGAEFKSKWVGEDEKLVRAIFSLARKLEPCVIFIDEADAVFRRRTSDDDCYHRDLVSQFLREWDGVNGGAKGGFVMAATNRPSDLDPAVLRRLPRRILVDVPSAEDREAILRIHLKDEILAPDVDIAALARDTPSHTGSDLKSLCVAAAMAAVYEELCGGIDATSDIPLVDIRRRKGGKAKRKGTSRRTLHARHFEHAMQEIRVGIDNPSISGIKQFGKMYRDNAM